MGNAVQEQQQQQVAQKTIVVQVETPPSNDALIITTGVVVPLVIAMVGWYLQSRWRKNHPGVPMTLENVKKRMKK